MCMEDYTNLAMVTCLSAVETKHCTTLFVETGLSCGWPSRIRDLLHIEVAKDDNHICKSCRNKLVTIERKLQYLRALAQESNERSGKGKHRKETRGTR